MKAVEMLHHFLSLADWVKPEDTVDRIILGDPEAEIRRVAVTWISSFDALRWAVARGADMLITHEPTFWRHRDELEMIGDKYALGPRKRKFIEDNGIVVLRNHDVWDRMPQIGIPWAWARFLGFGENPAAVSDNRYQHRYDIEPVRLDDLALRIAGKTAALGEPAVQVIGDGGRKVSKVGVGTGCLCDIGVFRAMGCDVSIVTDDGSCYWSGIQHAAEDGHPVVRVNHGTSEEPGMVTLTKYTNDHFPGLTAEHLPHRACFRLVGNVSR